MYVHCHPREIQNENVIAIAVEHNYSFAVTDRNEVFSWGLNTLGGLGLGDKKNKCLPKKIIFPQPRLEKKEVVISTETKESNYMFRIS